MDAHFRAKIAIGIPSCYHDGYAFDPGFVAGEEVENVRTESFGFSPAEIHAQQNICPVLGLGASGSGIDGEHGIIGVMFSREHAFQFQGDNSVIEFLEDQGRFFFCFGILFFMSKLQKYFGFFQGSGA